MGGVAADAACVADGVGGVGGSVACETRVELLSERASGERALVWVVGHLLPGLFFERLLVLYVFDEGRHGDGVCLGLDAVCVQLSIRPHKRFSSAIHYLMSLLYVCMCVCLE